MAAPMHSNGARACQASRGEISNPKFGIDQHPLSDAGSRERLPACPGSHRHGVRHARRGDISSAQRWRPLPPRHDLALSKWVPRSRARMRLTSFFVMTPGEGEGDVVPWRVQCVPRWAYRAHDGKGKPTRCRDLLLRTWSISFSRGSGLNFR
jgi:hypothetical protein